MRSSSALRQQLIRSLGSLALSQGTCSISWCWAEGYANGRSAPSQWIPIAIRSLTVVVVSRKLEMRLEQKCYVRKKFLCLESCFRRAPGVTSLTNSGWQLSKFKNRLKMLLPTASGRISGERFKRGSHKVYTLIGDS